MQSGAIKLPIVDARKAGIKLKAIFKSVERRKVSQSKGKTVGRPFIVPGFYARATVCSLLLEKGGVVGDPINIIIQLARTVTTMCP